MERWEDIPGFEGRYQASDAGNFKSCDWKNTRGYLRKARILKQNHDSRGYIQIPLVSPGLKSKLYLAHRLIGITFLPKIDGKDFINHLNGKKDDNRVSNLEWCTKSENAKHSFIIGTQNNKGINHPCSKFTDNQIREIRERHKNGESAYKLSKEFCMSYTNAKDIIAKRIWRHIC